MKRIYINEGTQTNASLFIFFQTKSYAELDHQILSEHRFLTPIELEKLKSLKLEKRRKDWLLGRFTIKSLIQEYFWEVYEKEVSLSNIEIKNFDDGAPYFKLVSETNFQVFHRRISNISISHSHETSLCAISDFAVGIDLEFIEKRSNAFIHEFFSDIEVRFMENVSNTLNHLFVNLIWSAKESVLKLFHLGLTVDTRYVICLPTEKNPIEGKVYEFQIQLNNKIYSKIEEHRKFQTLKGFWKIDKSFVYTFAVGT